jgi:hypothetical protein
MTNDDHGGFDIAIEIAESTLARTIGALSIPMTGTQSFSVGGTQGEIIPSVAISTATLVPFGTIRISLDLGMTKIHINQIVVDGIQQSVPPYMSDTTVLGTVTVDEHLKFSGNALVVDFTMVPPAGTPGLHVEINEDKLKFSPLFTFALSDYCSDPTSVACEQSRNQLLETLKTKVTEAVRRQISALGVRTLVPPPTLGARFPTYRIGNKSMHLLYATCGSGGELLLIKRSNLLRRTSDGLPLDVAAIIVSNQAFLSCVIRPAVTTALRLTPGGFIPQHPLMWLGQIALRIPGGLPALISGVFLTKILGGIDGTNLRILAEILVIGVGNAFNVRYTVDTTLSMNATVTGSTVIVSVSPLGTPAIRSYVNISGWALVGGFLSGGITLTGIMAAIDGIGVIISSGLIATAISPFLLTTRLPFTLPSTASPLTRRVQSFSQADAPTRTIGLTFAFLSQTLPFVDPFPSNDIIINLV